MSALHIAFLFPGEEENKEEVLCSEKKPSGAQESSRNVRPIRRRASELAEGV